MGIDYIWKGKISDENHDVKNTTFQVSNSNLDFKNNDVNRLYSGKSNLEKHEQIKSDQTKNHGYSMLIAALFVAGENAGCALLALPHALNESGWFGLFFIFLLGLNAAYAGIILARCWMILEERWIEFKTACRYPYPAIGLKTFGKYMRTFVTACVQITLIGSMVVILLLTSQIITNIAYASTNICFCTWIIIIAIILTPLTWFGTPSEFWPAAAGALATTTIAVILILIDSIQDFVKLEHKKNSLSSVNYGFNSIFLAAGTVMFAYGGTASFPTFQNDMKNKKKFPQSVLLGFIALIILYVPISLIGYLTYGENVNANIILNLPDGPKKLIAEFLMAAHLLFAFLLCATAPLQEIESGFKIPHHFTWKRPVIRSMVMLFVLFLALSVPNFGKVLDLIGGSTIALLSYVFPPLFYFKLTSMKNSNWLSRKIPLWEKTILVQIIFVGIFAGIACTYSAVISIWGSETFTFPCYIKLICDNNH